MKGLFHPLRNIILYKLHHKEKLEPGALFFFIEIQPYVSGDY